MADIVRRWGVNIDEDALIPPDQNSPRGDWRYPLVELSDELLRAVDSSWYVPPGDNELPRLGNLKSVAYSASARSKSTRSW